MDRMRPADRVRSCLAQPNVKDLAFAYELGHRTDRFLDRHFRVDSVLVAEVDVER